MLSINHNQKTKRCELLILMISFCLSFVHFHSDWGYKHPWDELFHIWTSIRRAFCRKNTNERTRNFEVVREKDWHWRFLSNALGKYIFIYKTTWFTFRDAHVNDLSILYFQWTSLKTTTFLLLTWCKMINRIWKFQIM